MNRHYIVCFFISAALPIIGLPLAYLIGWMWEYGTHDGHVPDDPDTLEDLRQDWKGAVHGQVVGLIFWTVIILKLL